MFLIWILDDFDIHNQGTLERDIKYLTEYENFFKLDVDLQEYFGQMVKSCCHFLVYNVFFKFFDTEAIQGRMPSFTIVPSLNPVKYIH